MDYISFTAIVAAGGALIFWFWYRGYRAGGGNALPRGNGMTEDAVPPRKRTISGQPESETEQIAFQRRMQDWEDAFKARGSRYNGRAQPLEGKRYTFVPRKRNGDPISNSA